jgi:hypothetical protein
MDANLLIVELIENGMGGLRKISYKKFIAIS